VTVARSRAGLRALSDLSDLIVRVWLVVTAWLGLRRAPRLRYLASIGHPARFVRAVVVPAGRHLALALAFLPRDRRLEARISFLACKALDAFEDLSPDRAAARAGISAAMRYLCGEIAHPPRGTDLHATRDTDRVGALLAARLPLLRSALEHLPEEAQQRCRALIARLGAGMVQARADRRCYADDVLGEAVLYAARVAAPGHAPPVAACRAAGRALQLANDVRDGESARAREVALYLAVPELPLVPRLLRWLPVGVGAGTRAAAALVAGTTCVFYLRQLQGARTRGEGTPAAASTIVPEVPRRLRHPIRGAIAAARSPRGYRDAIDAIEEVLRAALGALGAPLERPPHPGAPPGGHDTVDSASALVALAMELVHAVPDERLDATTPAAPGRAVAVADYLLFSAVEQLSSLGPASIGQVATLLERLAAPVDRDELDRSTALAAFAEEVG